MGEIIKTQFSENRETARESLQGVKGMVIFKCVIPGRAYIKKNTARHFRGGGVGYSKEYIGWERQAEMRIALAKKDFKLLPITEEVNLKALFYFKNKTAEPDLSNLYEGIQDVLQNMGVLANDKLIYGHDGSRKIFYEEPRLEIELTLINQAEVKSAS